MATITENHPEAEFGSDAEQRILLRDIDWGTYEILCERLGKQHLHLTYDRGDLEIMSPSPAHERYKMFGGYFIDNVVMELDEFESFEAYGETTWKRVVSERGLEADQCYYFDPAKLAIIDGRLPDRPDDPLPDLVIEVEISSSLINKMAVYAALGIPEVWRHDGETLKFELLSPDGTYRLSATSRFLPVRSDEVTHWLDLAFTMNPKAWTQRLRAWIREELVGRRP